MNLKNKDNLINFFLIGKSNNYFFNFMYLLLIYIYSFSIRVLKFNNSFHYAKSY